MKLADWGNMNLDERKAYLKGQIVVRKAERENEMADKIINVNALKNLVGQKVVLTSTNYGVEELHTGIVEHFQWSNDMRTIQVGGMSIPFLGYGCAVVTITDKDANILFHNPHAIRLDIRHSYLNPKEEFYHELVYLFGQKTAIHRRKDDERTKIEQQKRREMEDVKAKSKKTNLIEHGLQFIKPELQDEWRNYADKNTNDGYSCGVIEADCLAFEALSENKSCKEADNTSAKMGITGFMAGCVVRDITHFHARGNEYKRYWNKLWNKDSDGMEKGVVNPAILTFKGKS